VRLLWPHHDGWPGGLTRDGEQYDRSQKAVVEEQTEGERSTTKESVPEDADVQQVWSVYEDYLPPTGSHPQAASQADLEIYHECC
jgi:hypothetical protein